MKIPIKRSLMSTLNVRTVLGSEVRHCLSRYRSINGCGRNIPSLAAWGLLWLLLWGLLNHLFHCLITFKILFRLFFNFHIRNLFINIVLNKLVRLKKHFYFDKPLATTYINIIFIISLSIRNCDGWVSSPFHRAWRIGIPPLFHCKLSWIHCPRLQN